MELVRKKETIGVKTSLVLLLYELAKTSVLDRTT